MSDIIELVFTLDSVGADDRILMARLNVLPDKESQKWVLTIKYENVRSLSRWTEVEDSFQMKKWKHAIPEILTIWQLF